MLSNKSRTIDFSMVYLYSSWSIISTLPSGRNMRPYNMLLSLCYARRDLF